MKVAAAVAVMARGLAGFGAHFWRSWAAGVGGGALLLAVAPWVLGGWVEGELG